jgi:tetratricopeptide (TPR) repeat protein
MSYKIRWWFLLKFAVLLVALGVGVHFVHARQVKKQFGAYLDQANKAKDAGDVGKEADYLDRYLKANPNDIDARERLARLYCKGATKPREMENAYYALDDVLNRAPDRDDLRRYAIEFATDPRFGGHLAKEARGHAEVLLAKGPDADLEATRGRCLLAEQKFAEAAEAFEKSYKLKPDLAESYAHRAVTLRRHLGQPTDADKVINEMLAAGGGQFRAHLLAAQYWQTFAPLDRGADAEKAVAKAREIAGTEKDVLLMSADFARLRGRTLAKDGKAAEAVEALKDARALLEECVKHHPKTAGAYQALAALEADPRKAAAVVARGLAAVPDSVELTADLFEYQFQARDAAGAAETADKLAAFGTVRPEVVRYEKARVLVLRGKWTEAAPALAEVIPQLPPGPARRRANVVLAGCYEQLGEHQRRLDALLRAEVDPDKMGPDDPLWVVVALGVGEASAALGRTKEAIDAYTRLADRVPSAWAQVARLEITQALKEPEDKRNWDRAEAALKRAEAAVADKRIPDPVDVRLLRANLSHQQKDPAAARRQLGDLRAQFPKNPVVWVESAMQEAREGRLDDAFALLDRAATADGPGDGPDLRLARARLLHEQWRTGGKKDTEAVARRVAAQADGAEKFGPDARAKLLRSLYDVAALMGADAEAGRLAVAAADARPDDLGGQAVRFDLAARNGDVAGMEGVLQDIARIDGENGPFTRTARAAVLMERAKALDRGKKTAEARALRDQALAVLNGLEAEKVAPPLDARVALSQAMVLDRNGDNPRAAADKYQRAFDLGEVNPQAAVRLAALYNQTGQYARAVEVYKKLPEAIQNSPGVQRMRAGSTLGAGLPAEDALALAKKGIKEDSDDPQALLFLSQLYLATGDKDKPEALMRRAVQLKPEAADARLLLIQYLAGAGRKADAEKELEDAAKVLRAEALPVFRAAAYAQLGQPDKALEAFRAASKAKPDDPAVLLAEADYLLQLGRLAEARAGFQRVRDLPAAPAPVKRAATLRLAWATVVDPDYQVSSRAPAIVAEAGAGDTADDRAARIVVLAFHRDRSQRLEAIRLLEQIPARKPTEAFLLAQLHHSVGERAKGRDELRHLMGDDPKKWLPVHVSYMAQSLLRDGDAGGAAKWVAHLAEVEPESAATAVMKARLAVAQKDADKARAVLAAREKLPTTLLGPLARLYEELGQAALAVGDKAGADRLFADAERVLNLAIEQVKDKQPEAVLARAAFYGRRDRTRDAMGLLEEGRAKFPMTSVGAIAVNVLYAAKDPQKADMEKVAGWLEAAVGKAPDALTKATLHQQLGSVRNLQGDLAGAADLYRKALDGNPKDLVALNNLAYLLSSGDSRQYDEALGLVARAKQVVGENHDVRDTEAMILLNKGEAGAAAEIMAGVVAEAPSGTAYFHLAQAQLATKNEGKARASWAEAARHGLKRTDLHPNERRSYDEFATRFR